MQEIGYAAPEKVLLNTQSGRDPERTATLEDPTFACGNLPT